VTTWTQIATASAPSSDMFDFPSLDFSGYSVAQVVLSGATVTSDGSSLLVSFYVGGVRIVTGYRFGLTATSSAGTLNNDGDTSAIHWIPASNDANWTIGNATGEGFDSIITIDAPTSTALYKKAQFYSIATGPTGVVLASHGTALMENAGAIDGLRIAGSSAITAGTVRILGMA
jgi:hypothetical protein